MKHCFLFLCMLCAFWPSVASACEGCKMSAASGLKEPQTILAGFALSWSVLFLLAALLFLMTVLAWSIRVVCKQVEAAAKPLK